MIVNGYAQLWVGASGEMIDMDPSTKPQEPSGSLVTCRSLALTWSG
ncbi:MAG: hypothetical protein ACP5IE_08860 [Infirmifilum sp.]